jgi:hypothetical protein
MRMHLGRPQRIRPCSTRRTLQWRSSCKRLKGTRNKRWSAGVLHWRTGTGGAHTSHRSCGGALRILKHTRSAGGRLKSALHQQVRRIPSRFVPRFPFGPRVAVGGCERWGLKPNWGTSNRADRFADEGCLGFLRVLFGREPAVQVRTGRGSKYADPRTRLARRNGGESDDSEHAQTFNSRNAAAARIAGEASVAAHYSRPALPPPVSAPLTRSGSKAGTMQKWRLGGSTSVGSGAPAAPQSDPQTPYGASNPLSPTAQKAHVWQRWRESG